MENKSKDKRQKVESQKLAGRSYKKYFLSSIIFYLLSFVYSKANAQCAMCRASLESSGQEQQAEALNDGIVYLMVIPYLLIAVAGYFIYRMYTKKKS